VKPGGAVAGLADLLARAMEPIAAGVRALSRPLARLWRLASLRSQTRGSIPVSTQFDGAVTALGHGEVRLGMHCRLGRGVLFDTGDSGRIALGDRVRVNMGGVIVANVGVAIGDDTLIGEYVSIRDSNHGISSGALIRTQALQAAEIRVGRDVWIGRGCCIVAGVTIGDGAVIGANSVVTGDVPSHEIHAGAPARYIGDRKDEAENAKPAR
jgi:acetyltransferase-like isoleucine patch superfamily enzyme